MRTFLLTVLQVLFTIAILPTAALHAQSPPADFSFSATTGGTAPWSEMARITIDNTGQAKYVRFKTGGASAILAESTFTVSTSGLQQLWKTIQDSSYFSLDPSWADTTVRGGSFVVITITANGTTHQVRVRNIAQPSIQSIINTLNAIVPSNLQLDYTPPDKFDSTPRDTCVTYGALQGRAQKNPTLENSRDQKLRAFPGPYFPSALHPQSTDASHPGVVVSCDMDIQEAVADGVATLSSKGNFFGDGLTITVDNRNTPPCNTINITVYLEFWGPLATPDDIAPMIADIEKEWEGATTSSGQPITITVNAIENTSATSPPNTPGYDDINLAEKGFRSYVNGGTGFGPNVGTDQGKWGVQGDPGEYAHETAHLMGLPDRYNDYYWQPGGSWKDPETGNGFANDHDFATYLNAKYPDKSVSSFENTLKDQNVYSVPWDGHEHDLMGDLTGKLLQSDIDAITAHPGLLVHVPAATVFLDRDHGSQNLITSHGDDIYAKPGERRIVLGIYVACIDHFKGPPGISTIFDVAPPLKQWSGIAAAGYMGKLLHYVDSVRLYCDMNSATQEAIWRISDNAVPAFPEVDSLLAAAGLNIGGLIMDFPRLLGSSATDSASHTYLPDQLYVAHFQPTYASGQIGAATRFLATISHPQNTAAPVGMSWTATGPDGAPAPIADLDSTASLTPTRSGIYRVALQLSMNDSVHGQQRITPDQSGYVIVPDQYTETFEHPGLADNFPWQSYGDIPWTITSASSETGSFAVTPGTGPEGQSSTLGIDVSVPADTTIVFSVRSLTESLFDGVEFKIDSSYVDFYGDGTDWTVYSYRLKAGTHRLTWTHKINAVTTEGNVWIDNIFFPGNVVVTSVSDKTPDVPKVFALEQNYPNPFNPKTGIRYQVPGVSTVNITVYDILGREVAVLVNEQKLPGRYQVTFDGAGLASGFYIYRLTAGSFSQTRKMLLLK